MTDYRDPIVNGAGFILAGAIIWLLIRYANSPQEQQSVLKNKLVVLLLTLAVYVFTVPAMYPSGDLWAITIIDVISGSPFGSGQPEQSLDNLIPVLESPESPTTLEEIIFWAKMLGLAIHGIIFFALSVIPRTVAVISDDIRELLGIEDE